MWPYPAKKSSVTTRWSSETSFTRMPQIASPRAFHTILALCCFLPRLAVDRHWQGKGLGAALVADALRRAIQVADIAGVRAVLVHAKDDAARRFYEHLGFEPFPGEPLVLYRLMKDLRSMLQKK